MRLVFYDSDDPEAYYDNPNLYWGEDGAYLLEPGDPGYLSSTPTKLTRKKKQTIMASNATPRNKDELIALGQDIDAGLVALEVSVGVKQNTHAKMRADLIALIGDDGPPPVPGADKLFEMAQAAEKEAARAVSDLDAEATEYLGKVRKWLASLLGNQWNAAWIPTGFPDNKTAVPRKQDARHTLLGSLRNYFTAHPEHEVTTPELVITAAACDARHTAISAARAVANTASAARATAGDVCEAAVDALSRRVGGTVSELSDLLPADDGRWETFGLNIPADPDLPEAVATFTLTAMGGSNALAEWPRSRRSRRYRLFIQVMTVDDDFRFLMNVTGSGPTLQKLLEDLPVGKTVRGKVVAANDAGEAAASPVGEAAIT